MALSSQVRSSSPFSHQKPPTPYSSTSLSSWRLHGGKGVVKGVGNNMEVLVKASKGV